MSEFLGTLLVLTVFFLFAMFFSYLQVSRREDNERKKRIKKVARLQP
ncbi:hypothetical protein [Floricoccus tropicus]|nr:hypothetical protein [Floricoccus tropicus]